MSDTVTIDGQAFELDDFEIGELEWLEDHLGKPITDFTVLNSMKAAVGLVYLVKRREDPSFTIEQARADEGHVDLPGPRRRVRGRDGGQAPSQEARSRLARERRQWMPVLARVYGIPPQDQPSLKLWQFRALQDDYLKQQQEGGE
jgi:hypothetical protein